MRQRTPLLPVEAKRLTETIQCHLEETYVAAQQLADLLADRDPLRVNVEALMLRLSVAEARLALILAEVNHRP